ncbi:MAG TPA: hypothetical protein VJP84_17285 [Steroidobacteraceae bacterium]|jgi:uncharacterized protein YdeI (BOF family)|nr:hypothetical protein [Steroidobacteraceae bacterium]
MRYTILSLMFLIAGAAFAADAPAPAARWHVEINGAATSDGHVQLRLTPHEGEAITIDADIKQGRGELFITRDLGDACKSQLPKKRFKSEVVGGKLLVKAGPGEADFTLELVESTVAGARVHITAD